ncbi:unnamed protein product [Psylliodes chrysocephalus]|uniref:Uncharacterized protein n=1 Tax=Psylliodes chrysocephalus TaxID=3402493 RepID=A0A9P0D7L1_9CUCU|nr:unnamed protein product [Psylliodes chrysocephala]
MQLDAKLSGKGKRNKQTKKVLLEENEDCSDDEQQDVILCEKGKQRKQINKVLLQENIDSSDDEHHSLFSKDFSSDDDIEWAKSPSPPIEEEIHREPKSEDFVLIKFPIKRTTDNIYYVAKILKVFDLEVKISCLRKCAKNDKIFYFPNVEDISIPFKEQIDFVLPNPENLQRLTKRKKSLVLFSISLDQYNVR